MILSLNWLAQQVLFNEIVGDYFCLKEVGSTHGPKGGELKARANPPYQVVIVYNPRQGRSG